MSSLFEVQRCVSGVAWFWRCPLHTLGAGPVLAPTQKPRWNSCQQAKVSFSLRTKITYFFRSGFLFPIDIGGLIRVRRLFLIFPHPFVPFLIRPLNYRTKVIPGRIFPLDFRGQCLRLSPSVIARRNIVVPLMKKG